MANAPLLKLYQREDKSLRLIVTSPSEVDNDSTSATYNPEGLVDLTPHELRLTMKRNLNDDDADALITKTSATPGEIDFETQTALPWTSSSTRGEALAFFIPTDSDPTVNEAMIAGSAWLDVWLVLGSGEQKLVLSPTLIDIRDAVGP